MAMRAQCSLQFSDKELYENFIVPMKQSKELNSIIIKCLKAYYYDPQARESIEGQTDSDMNIDESSVSTQQDMINNIRQSLMMQSYMAQEMEDTLANGVEDISDILHNVNDVAESSGAVHRTETDYSSGILRIDKVDIDAEAKTGEVKPTITPKVVQKPNQTSNSADENDKLNLMASILFKLIVKSGDKESADMLSSMFNSQATPVEEQIQPTQSDTDIDEHINDKVEEPNEEEFFEEVSDTIEETTETEKVEEQVEEQVEEDSTDLLGSLLSDFM